MKAKMTLALCSALTVSPVFAADMAEETPVQPSTTEQQSVTEPLSPQKQMAKLAYDAQDVRLSDGERAAALRQLAAMPTQNGLVAVTRALKDDSAIVREAAIIGADPYQFEHRWRMVSPLLTDNVDDVRITAAASLVRDFPTMEVEEKTQLEKSLAELISHLDSQTDEASRLLLGDVYRWTGDTDKSEVIYSALIAQNPNNPQVWLNLSDNYRAANQDSKAIGVLDDAIKALPDNANFHYAKSLAYVRLGEKASAAFEIDKATTLAPNNSYFWYLNGVLQEDSNLDLSVRSFEQAYVLSGAPEHLYAVCDVYVRYGNEKAKACLDELSNVAPPYVIEQLQQKAI